MTLDLKNLLDIHNHAKLHTLVWIVMFMVIINYLIITKTFQNIFYSEILFHFYTEFRV